MKNFWKWCAGIATAIAATLFFFRKKDRKTIITGPTKSPVTDVLVKEINESLEEDIEDIWDAVEDEHDPAKELADIGNRRSRE